MARIINNLFAVKQNAGGTFDVWNETREFPSIGPSLGKTVSGFIVAGKLASKYDAELVKTMFDCRHVGELFSVAATVSRRIEMLAVDNPEFAENPGNPISY